MFGVCGRGVQYWSKSTNSGAGTHPIEWPYAMRRSHARARPAPGRGGSGRRSPRTCSIKPILLRLDACSPERSVRVKEGHRGKFPERSQEKRRQVRFVRHLSDLRVQDSAGDAAPAGGLFRVLPGLSTPKRLRVGRRAQFEGGSGSNRDARKAPFLEEKEKGTNEDTGDGDADTSQIVAQRVRSLADAVDGGRDARRSAGLEVPRTRIDATEHWIVRDDDGKFLARFIRLDVAPRGHVFAAGGVRRL